MFNETMYISDLHEEYLKEDYFPLVMQIPRYPRYKNKRAIDPHVKLYLDEMKIPESPEWGLPVPNEEAAYKSLSKYAKDIKAMSEEQVDAMNLAWEWTTKHFGVYMQNSVVRGVDEVIENLDMNTSSGAPFNIKYPTKKELFAAVPDLRDWLIADWEVLGEDENYTFLFTSSLKEEVRPYEKIISNKIRTFLAGAVDGTVHGNRLFADMNDKMNASHLKSSSGVGMSPYGGNWDRLYRKLNIFDKGYALDESEYDSSLRAYLMWGCALCRWKMLRPEDQTRANLRRLKTYYRNLVNSLIVTAEGVLVFKKTGNPSGSVNTINDNTLILYTLLGYSWIRLSGDKPSYSEFEDNTSKILVGDDNTWTVSEWAHEFFNAKTVISEWNKIGITTTTDSLEPRRAADLDFLSAHTIFYKDQAVPVYDRTKLMTSLLYAPTLHHVPAVTLTRAAALLTVGWTDFQFRKFSREFIEWLLQKYDTVCANDPEWILAKSGILTDSRLSKLFLGRTVMYIQSIQYPETQERLIKLDKTKMSLRPASKKSQVHSGQGARVTLQRKNNNRNKRRNGGLVNVDKIKMAKRIPRGTTHMAIPKGARYVGLGDYTEEKGRRLYDRKKEKKRTRRQNKGEKSGWWDTAGTVAAHILPMLGKAAIGALTGFGDYDISTNSVSAVATGGKLGGEIPLMENSHSANIIHHREYIGPVFGSTTPFKIDRTISVNPGLPDTFPWGARIANCYTRYRMRGAVVIYEPLASEFTTTGSLGFVNIASQYNPLDAPFTNKIELLNSEYASPGRPCDHVVHPIECAPKQMAIEEYYVRDALPPANADIRFYDLCTTVVAVGSNPVDTQIGDLWMTYEVEYYQPKIATTPNPEEVLTYFADKEVPAAWDIAHPLESMIPDLTGNNMKMILNTAGSLDYLEFPPTVTSGDFLVLFNSQDGSPATVTAGHSPLTLSVELEQTWVNSFLQNATLVTDWGFAVEVKVKKPGGRIYFDFAGFVVPNNGTPYRQLTVTRIHTPPTALMAKKVFDSPIYEESSSEETEEYATKEEMLSLISMISTLTQEIRKIPK